MLGHVLLQVLCDAGHYCLGLDLPDCDITDIDALRSQFSLFRPELDVNTAAYTNVDGAEDNIELCNKINVTGNANVATMCLEFDSRCVYISTDYVFNGNKTGEYIETDRPDPLSVYGKSKLLGEETLLKILPVTGLIVRTSWLYGEGGKNFPSTMLALARSGKSLRVVDDQIGSPTYTVDLVKMIIALIEKNASGIYHTTNMEFCSWYEFAKCIFELTNIHPTSFVPCHTSEYRSVARRPLNSRMSKDKFIKLTGVNIPSWQDAIERYLRKISEI